MKKEIWKSIPGYEGRYMVSNKGNVKSLISNNKILRPGKSNIGYLKVGLSNGGKMKGYFVHRLVMLSFIGPDKKRPYVNHINCIKTDNRLENLEWCTHKENIMHSRKNWVANNKTGADHHRSRPIDCFDLMGNLIKKYHSITETTKDGFRISSVWCVLNGWYTQTRECKFKYSK